VGSLSGFPVYGDTLFISRPGRELFVPVSVGHALKTAMPVYARNSPIRRSVNRDSQNTALGIASTAFGSRLSIICLVDEAEDLCVLTDVLS
jgi:hypothetical protein